MAPPPPRATLRVTTACSGACVFCAQAGLDTWPGVPTLEELRSESDALTFVGGEPGEIDNLPDWIRRARAAGFSEVGVQSNARALAAPGVLEMCREAGLTDLHLSVHGASAAIHDHHAGVPGSFAAAVSVLDRARGLDIPAQVLTVLTRSNFRVLDGMPAFLRRHGAVGWLVEVPVTAGRLSDRFAPVYPRLALAIPHALKAVAAARKRSLAAWIRGAPACLLGPLSALALPAPLRTHAPVCDDCGARPTCPGLDATYLQRFGGDELRARDPAPTAVETPLTRAFVGPGPLADRAPTRSTRSLPVL